MAREKQHYREVIEHLLSINGGKISDSDVGWQRTLNMTRYDFENRYGKKKGLNKTVYQIADGLL
ncbi:MAG: hypothetical protein E7365_06165 [Clostridiales bacterium]|nr:hypothetical protein [Clostridiales bacterium]